MGKAYSHLWTVQGLGRQKHKGIISESQFNSFPVWVQVRIDYVADTQ